MALEAFASLLEAKNGGLWFLPSHVDPKAVQKHAKSHDFAFVHFDGKNITGKDQLMNHVATALRLSKTFGHNWDALEESLVDLEWVDDDGFVIYYDHIDALLNGHPDQFETLVEIFRDAVESWKEDGTAMIVLLSGTKGPKGVPKLKAD